MSLLNVDEYLKELLRLLQMQRVDPTVFDAKWLDQYEKIKSHHFDVSVLPDSMALIHPLFMNVNGKKFETDLPWRTKRIFEPTIVGTQLCEAMRVFGTECIFNENIDIRGTCEADHYWPYGLGGPTIADNRAYLCRFHNQAKGSDIVTYAWNVSPAWLPIMLEQIRNKKI